MDEGQWDSVTLDPFVNCHEILLYNGAFPARRVRPEV